MFGLFGEEPDGGIVGDAGPLDAARFDVLADRSDGADEFALLHGESAEREIDRGAFLEEQQGFQKRYGIFAAGDGDGDAVPVTDHVEARDGFAGLAEESLFEIHGVP